MHMYKMHLYKMHIYQNAPLQNAHMFHLKKFVGGTKNMFTVSPVEW